MAQDTPKVRLTLSLPEPFSTLLEYVAFRLGTDRSALVVDVMGPALRQMYAILQATPPLDRLTPEERDAFITRCQQAAVGLGLQLGLDLGPPREGS